MTGLAKFALARASTTPPPLRVQRTAPIPAQTQPSHADPIAAALDQAAAATPRLLTPQTVAELLVTTATLLSTIVFPFARRATIDAVDCHGTARYSDRPV